MGTCLSSSSTADGDSARSPNKSSRNLLGKLSSKGMKWADPLINVLPACDPIRLLGEGTFGTVVLVRERSTQEFFAIKVMNKSQLVHEAQLDNIIVERQVLREAGPHPFIVECLSGFQTGQAVVLVLEYLPGGDLYDLLKKHGCLSEDDTRFYLSEIVVALAELHRHNFVFRDLKLENILVDTQGHCRLTDFGLAGKVMWSAAGETPIFDISGTAIYQAPEMLDGKGHGRVVDWWALGVLAYVMLSGRPPFAGDSREALYDKISSEPLNLDNDERLGDVSAVTKDLIMCLLDKDPTTRLGSGGTDARGVQSHPFFNGVDWTAVSNAELTPPLSPGKEPRSCSSNADDVKLAEKKLAEKVLRKFKPSRSALGKLKKDLDVGEYKMVMANKNESGSTADRVSIGLDFSGRNQEAAGKTWTDSSDDFGREL